MFGGNKILNGRGIVNGNFFDSDLASLKKKKLRKQIVLNRLFNTPEVTFRKKKKFSECPIKWFIINNLGLFVPLSLLQGNIFSDWEYG